LTVNQAIAEAQTSLKGSLAEKTVPNLRMYLMIRRHPQSESSVRVYLPKEEGAREVRRMELKKLLVMVVVVVMINCWMKRKRESRNL